MVLLMEEILHHPLSPKNATYTTLGTLSSRFQSAGGSIHCAFACGPGFLAEGKSGKLFELSFAGGVSGWTD